MSCPGYNEDPPCKTIRKLTQKVQTKPPVVLEEPCPKCGKPLLQRDGAYGEFIACSGYPKCKYVKQELLDVPYARSAAAMWPFARPSATRRSTVARATPSAISLQQPDAGERDVSRSATPPTWWSSATTRERTWCARTIGNDCRSGASRRDRKKRTRRACRRSARSRKKLGRQGRRKRFADRERPDPEKTRTLVEATA